MTTDRLFGTDFAVMDWIRQNCELDSQTELFSVADIDLVVHRYRDRNQPNPKRRIDNLMVVETKSHQRGPWLPRDPSRGAADTLAVWHAILSGSVGTVNLNRAVQRVRSSVYLVNGERRRVRTWGLHVWSLSGDRPENSTAMWWDRFQTPISVAAVLEVLRFVRDPYTLEPIDYRDHHEGEIGRKPLLRAVQRNEVA